MIDFIKNILQKSLCYYERRTVGDVLLYSVLWSIAVYATNGKFRICWYFILTALTFIGYWIISLFERKQLKKGSARTVLSSIIKNNSDSFVDCFVWQNKDAEQGPDIFWIMDSFDYGGAIIATAFQ